MIVVRSLGQCVIDVDDTPITPESEVVFALLLYLASHAGRTLPRRALVDLLWPTADDRSARHCLRQTLYRLRRLGVPLRATAESVTLSADVVSLAHDALQVQIASGDLRLPDGAYLPGYLPRLSAPSWNHCGHCSIGCCACSARFICRCADKWSSTPTW